MSTHDPQDATDVQETLSLKSKPIPMDGSSNSPPGHEVIRELGRGGMGVVYLARQVKANRLVALKMILAASHAEASELARFRSEAETIARLQHPNIVQVFDVSEHEGLPYFSLEYCAGGTLARKLNGTPQEAREAARLVEVLARAMQAAHEQKVIHRDLKPANVLLLADGTPKVTDFGLAKKLDDVRQTRTGAIMGTPSYMAPEQADERAKTIGPAADVYALGAVLYECLTGRPPFKAATMMDTLIQVLQEEPIPPSRLAAKVPRDLETICLACLHKEPSKRYRSAEDLAEDLRCFQGGEPIQARPVGRLERVWRWCRRNPAVASLLLAVFLSLGLGAALAGSFAMRAQERAEDAEVARTAEATRAEEAEQARQAAVRSEQTALKERDAKEQERQRAQQNLYFNRIALAERAGEVGNVILAREHLAGTPPSLRHWEYSHLYALAHTPVLTLLGHTDKVGSVTFSPDGRHIASASSAQTVKVWDAHTGQEQLSLKGHTIGVYSVAFSPDGKSIASGGRVGVKVWDAQVRQELVAGQLRRIGAADPAWHEEQESQAEAAQDAFAAGFHLQRLVALQPWNADLHVRRAHQLIRTNHREEAALHFLEAVSLGPNVPLWPLDPNARTRGLEAARKGNWSCAAAWLELAAHQPEAARNAWQDRLHAHLAADRMDPARQLWRDLALAVRSTDYQTTEQLVFATLGLPLAGPDAARLVQMAAFLVTRQRNAINLQLLGIGLYRAARYEEAARTLEESIRVQGQGGFIVTRMFLGMTRHQQGQRKEARKHFDAYESWYSQQKFDDLILAIHLKRLHDEAKALIRTMPRVTD